MDPPANALVSNNAPTSTDTNKATMEGLRDKSSFNQCLAARRRLASKNECKQHFTAAAGRHIYDCLLARDDLSVPSFKARVKESAEKLLKATGEELPDYSTLQKKNNYYTIDKTVLPWKIRVNGYEMVYEENVYDIALSAIKAVAAEKKNHGASLSALIKMAQPLFGTKNGLPEFQKYNFNASLLKYLKRSVREPTVAAAEQPETAIAPSHFVRY